MNTISMRGVEDAKRFFRYTGDDPTLISGHRGGAAAGFPENCIPTFEHTLSVTPAIFEIDSHLTSDGGTILMHDSTLDRTSTGTGPIIERTLAEVRALYLKDGVGAVTDYHPPTLDEVIAWCIGKTILDLDVKNVPAATKCEIVGKHNAWGNVIFTVPSAQEARVFYDLDHRSLLAAPIFDVDAFKTYEAAGVPWDNIAIAWVGALDKPENAALYDKLHKNGVKAMVAAAPSYDKLPTPEERAEGYRQIVKGGADIIESDRPLEVAAALKALT